MKYKAVYMRVSSRKIKGESRQSTASQKLALQRHIKANRITGCRWFEDHASGRSMKREHLQTIIDDAKAGKISHLLIYKLDRFGRTIEIVNVIRELVNAGVIITSITEGFKFDDSPMGKCILTIMAALAEAESDHISARVRSGLAVAKAQGKRLGAKPDNRKRYRLKRLLKNHSLKEAAAIIGITYQAAWKMRKRIAA